VLAALPVATSDQPGFSFTNLLILLAVIAVAVLAVAVLSRAGAERKSAQRPANRIKPAGIAS